MASSPIDIARRAGSNLARVARRTIDRTSLPQRDGFWLVVRLTGSLEELPLPGLPFARGPWQNLLDVLETLEAAAEDPQVDGVLLHISGSVHG